MTTRFARFLLLFAALWLPVQAMAALSVLLRRHAQEQAVVSPAALPAAKPCHEAAVHDQAPNHDVGCDDWNL